MAQIDKSNSDLDFDIKTVIAIDVDGTSTLLRDSNSKVSYESDSVFFSDLIQYAKLPHNL